MEIDVMINGHKVEFLMDSGANVNVLSLKTLNEIFKGKSYYLRKSNVKLRLYNNTLLDTLGKILLRCKRNGNFFDLSFVIVKKNLKPILSGNTCIDMNLIKIIADLNAEQGYLTVEQLTTKYEELFTGIGCIS